MTDQVRKAVSGEPDEPTVVTGGRLNWWRFWADHVPQRHPLTRLRMLAESSRNTALLRCQPSHSAYQVVGYEGNVDFFRHHIRSGAGKLIQTQCALESPQVGFDVPPSAVERHDLFGRVRKSV